MALPPYRIRQVHQRDLAWIAQIECLVQPTPWSLAVLEMSRMTDAYFYLAERIPAINPPFADKPEGSEVDNENPFLGFLVARLIAPVAEITNFGIHPRYQNQGLGQVFLNHLIDTLPSISPTPIEEVHLEVRVSNARAIALYQKNGFVINARRKHYYDLAGGKEDGLLMTKYGINVDPPFNKY